MIGIGTDLVELDRFRLALARTPSIVDRLFSAEERDYAGRQADPAPRLAVRFAAKEAVLKAMGIGLWNFPLREIEVARAESGVPSVVLHGKAAAMAADRGVDRWLLTLTHTESLAQAVAVALPR
ncbi:MAG: holo-ACP synthase [Acidobacteria bacterium]|nr:holo-ACP synthase [Acidobacteriota bacterium]